MTWNWRQIINQRKGGKNLKTIPQRADIENIDAFFS